MKCRSIEGGSKVLDIELPLKHSTEGFLQFFKMRNNFLSEVLFLDRLEIRITGIFLRPDSFVGDTS